MNKKYRILFFVLPLILNGCLHQWGKLEGDRVTSTFEKNLLENSIFFIRNVENEMEIRKKVTQNISKSGRGSFAYTQLVKSPNTSGFLVLNEIPSGYIQFYRYIIGDSPSNTNLAITKHLENKGFYASKIEGGKPNWEKCKQNKDYYIYSLSPFFFEMSQGEQKDKIFIYKISSFSGKILSYAALFFLETKSDGIVYYCFFFEPKQLTFIGGAGDFGSAICISRSAPQGKELLSAQYLQSNLYNKFGDGKRLDINFQNLDTKYAALRFYLIHLARQVAKYHYEEGDPTVAPGPVPEILRAEKAKRFPF